MGRLSTMKIYWVLGDSVYSELSEKGNLERFKEKYIGLLGANVEKSEARKRALEYCGVRVLDKDL